MKKFFTPGNDSKATTIGLLILRLFIGLTMLFHHGIEKLGKFSSLTSSFPDPLGIGHTPSAVLTIFAEVAAAALLAVGLFTRFAALVLAIEMAVAFVLVHKATLGGDPPGELAFLYLAGSLTLLIAGGGKISLDKAVFK